MHSMLSNVQATHSAANGPVAARTHSTRVVASVVKLSIILATLLSTFATTTPPDLCDDVFLDASGDPVTDLVGQTLSRYCEWTGPHVPVWDANVCCTFADDAADCTRTNTRGYCPTGTAKRYCEHGSLNADGRVICYQPFPSMCDAGLCVEAPESPPDIQAVTIACCSAGGACQWVYDVDDLWDCQGELQACNYGTTNADGTVECWN
jgi:hypothetical protein